MINDHPGETVSNSVEVQFYNPDSDDENDELSSLKELINARKKDVMKVNAPKTGFKMKPVVHRRIDMGRR
jgi:hypothetical protein